MFDAHPCFEYRSPEPSFTEFRRALVVGGDAFDGPGRLPQIGEEQRIAPEDVAQHVRSAAHFVQMESMRQFVGKQHLQPDTVVQQFAVVGRREEDGALVERQRGGVTVGDVEFIEHDDLDPAARFPLQFPAQAGIDALGDVGHALGLRALGRGVIDAEMRAVGAMPIAVGIRSECGLCG